MIAGVLGLVTLCLVVGVALVTTIFWIWMLVDCVTNRGLSSIEKLMWVLVMLFTHVLGAILYFFVGRSQRRAGLG